MVHHSKWDRQKNYEGGYMQHDHDEMKEIIKEMAPGGKHYHAFKDGSVKTDAQILHSGASAEVVHAGKSYDPSLPSFYHGQWYKSSNTFLMSIIRVMLLIVIVFMFLKFVKMASRKMASRKPKRSSRFKSKSRKLFFS